MKVLIADDEYLVRTSLTSMLNELDMKLDIVGEATNGEEMVELIKKYTPDIAFVDVRMPKLNGLEAIKAARDYSPYTQWVILTGFSEFDYAKEAIKLGASRYILKPASPEELEEILVTFEQRNRENNEALNKEFENELIAMSHDLISFSGDCEFGIIGDTKFICSIFVFDSYLDEKEKNSYQLKFFNAIKTVINEFSTSEVRLALFPLPSGELASAGAWAITPESKGSKVIQKYFEIISRISAQFNSEQFSITIMQSDICISYEMLHKRLNQLQNLSILRVLMSVGKSYTIDELSIQYEKASSGVLKLASELLMLVSAYKEKSYLIYMKLLGDIETSFKNAELSINISIFGSISKFLSHSINCTLDNGFNIKKCIDILKVFGEKLLSEVQKEENTTQDISYQVMSIVERDYMQDIGIGQIAEQLNITPNYLSTMFHKKTGITFMKYLTKVRMLKAGELLAKPNAQVQKVAEKVGYYSTRHFTKLFKEQFGFYPSEYRDRFTP